MEFIDKTKGHDQAYTTLSKFLSRCQEEGFSPDDDLYSKMDSDRDSDVPGTETTKKILRRQLLQENNNRCCYCQRTIDEGNTTLEHIIPNRIADQESYNRYEEFYSSSDWQKMVFSKAFLKNPCCPFHAFPHTVAYENLIPSCNGKFAKISSVDIHARDTRTSKCCNNKRGEDFVIPFVLDAQMVCEFEYLPNGWVTWPVNNNIKGDERKRLLEERKNTIDVLGLNCPELVAIRKIWWFLSTTKTDCTINNKDRTVLFLTEEPGLMDEEKHMLNNFWQDNYWCLLEEYRYFNDVNKFKM